MLLRRAGSDNPNLPGADTGSGSPVFLAITNSVNQTDLVYFGHVTNRDINTHEVFGPSYFNCHTAILNAINQLNAAHPGTGNYQPTYVANGQWVR
jgi:hypothetical protein